MAELHEVERFLHPRVPLRLGHAVDLEPVGDVVCHRHMREHGVGLEHHVHGAAVRRNFAHVLAVDIDVALGRHFEAGEHAQQRRLAAARRPEQGEELAWLDVEADIVHADRLAPPLGNVAETDDRLDGGVCGVGAAGCRLVHDTHPFVFFCALPCITIIKAISTMVSRISMVDAALTSGVTEKRSIE